MTLPTSEIPPDQAFLAHCVDYASPHIEGLRSAMHYLRTTGIPDDPIEAEAFMIEGEVMTSVGVHIDALRILGPQFTAFGELLAGLGTEYAEVMAGAVQAREERLRGRQ